MMKLTKKEMFAQILAVEEVAQNEVMVEFINHELELLNKKSSSKKETATQKANEVLKGTIQNVLATCENGATISELQALNEELGELSNQKVSAIVRQMVLEGTVTKTVEGKKSVFALV